MIIDNKIYPVLLYSYFVPGLKVNEFCFTTVFNTSSLVKPGWSTPNSSTSGISEVCVSKCLMVMPSAYLDSSGIYFETGSSYLILFFSASIIIVIAVNCFETEARQEIVEGLNFS